MQYRLFLIDLTREALPITKLTQEGSEVALGQTSACEPDDLACCITQCGVHLHSQGPKLSGVGRYPLEAEIPLFGASARGREEVDQR